MEAAPSWQEEDLGSRSKKQGKGLDKHPDNDQYSQLAKPKHWHWRGCHWLQSSRTSPLLWPDPSAHQNIQMSLLTVNPPIRTPDICSFVFHKSAEPDFCQCIFLWDSGASKNVTGSLASSAVQNSSRSPAFTGFACRGRYRRYYVTATIAAFLSYKF